MKKFSLKVGIDVDGVLKECFEYACRLANKEMGLNLIPDKTRSYNLIGTEYEPVLKYFNNPDFVKTQPLYDGAREFIEALQQRAEVFIITAVPPEVMSVRACSLMEQFPTIPKENIILGTRKELVKVDILLDDCPNNVVDSETAYPVLMRRPWNSWMTGCLSVNNYDEFLTLVDSILAGYTKKRNTKGNKIFCLVGPSASGKTVFADELIRQNKAKRVVSYTTRKKRDGEINGISYYFVTEKCFLGMKNTGRFFETTTYAGHYYGSLSEDITEILKHDNVVMPLDICGAISMKRQFPDHTVIVFMKRDKRDLIAAILERNITNEEKTNRIISLSDELKNEVLADIVIKNDRPIIDLVTEFI